MRVPIIKPFDYDMEIFKYLLQTTGINTNEFRLVRSDVFCQRKE